MSLFRAAALLLMGGVAFSAVGKPATPISKNSATTPPLSRTTSDVVAGSVSVTLPFAEGDFHGLALKTSIRSSPQSASSTASAASENNGSTSPALSSRSSTNLRARTPRRTAKRADTIGEIKSRVEQISQGLLRLLQPRSRHAHGAQCSRPTVCARGGVLFTNSHNNGRINAAASQPYQHQQSPKPS
jgi:hypothetical protein